MFVPSFTLHIFHNFLSCISNTMLNGKLYFLGTKRNWFDFGNNIVCTILDLLKDSLKTLLDAIADGNLERYRIRITEYSKVYPLPFY